MITLKRVSKRKSFKCIRRREDVFVRKVQLFIDVPILSLSVTLAFPHLPVFPIRETGQKFLTSSHMAMTSSISPRKRRRLFWFSCVGANIRGSLARSEKILLKPSINSYWSVQHAINSSPSLIMFPSFQYNSVYISVFPFINFVDSLTTVQIYNFRSIRSNVFIRQVYSCESRLIFRDEMLASKGAADICHHRDTYELQIIRHFSN